jgi:multidrug efflux pump subunit AcrA (membrane-fusion protein)
VQASEKGFVAYVVEGDTARQRPLKIGLRTADGRVEVLSGLSAGQTVVVEGSDRLADGVKVQDADATPAGGAAAPAGTGR